MLLCMICTVFLFSCQNRISSYSATIMITSDTDHALSVRFDTLKGRLCKSFRKGEDGEGMLSYSASLGEGALSVSYEAEDGTLCPLFSIRGGESLSDTGGYMEGRSGKRIHLVIETEGRCKDGEVRIAFSKGVQP